MSMWPYLSGLDKTADMDFLGWVVAACNIGCTIVSSTNRVLVVDTGTCELIRVIVIVNRKCVCDSGVMMRGQMFTGDRMIN